MLILESVINLVMHVMLFIICAVCWMATEISTSLFSSWSSITMWYTTTWSTRLCQDIAG